MAYVSIPKDLTRVKSKLLFNLTKRQCVCFGGGALVGVPLFFLLKSVIPTSAAALLMVVIMLPFFMFALYEQNGQPLEKVLQHFIQARFVRPKHRLYQTDNFYAVSMRQIKLYKEVKTIEKQAKANKRRKKANSSRHRARKAGA